jgi:hypothetical protein
MSITKVFSSFVIGVFNFKRVVNLCIVYKNEEF